jgi:hypothetical protein
MADDETPTSGEGAGLPDEGGTKPAGGDTPDEQGTTSPATPPEAAETPTASLDTGAGVTAELPPSGGDTAPLPAAKAGTGGSDADAAAGTAQHRPARWRGIVAVVLIVLATLLAPLTLAVLWMNHDLMNTDNYVKTVAPLSSNAAVQTAIATDLTDQLWSKVDVSQQLAGVLPSWAQVFAAPLSNQLKAYTYQAAHAIVGSPAFSKVWEVANRQAHSKVQAALLGNQGGVVQTTGGQVSIDLAPAVDKVKAALDAKGIHALDTVATTPGATTFVLFRSESLARAQKAVKFFHKLSVALPLLLIAAWAGAIAVSRRRRRTVLQLGFTLALAMAVTLVGYHLGRGAYLNAVVSSQLPRPAAAAIFDTLVVGVLAAARTVFVVGLVIWLGALIAGPAGWAVKLRGALAGAFESAGTRAEEKGLDLGPVGSWVARHHRALQIAGLVVAAAVLVFWGTPGVAGVLWTVVILLIYLAIVEFVGRLTRPATADAAVPKGGEA